MEFFLPEVSQLKLEPAIHIARGGYTLIFITYLLGRSTPKLEGCLDSNGTRSADTGHGCQLRAGCGAKSSQRTPETFVECLRHLEC